jgi:hypothetical protein
MLRNDIVNFLIKKVNAKKYLEIGICNGFNFTSINCDYKVGVDPDSNTIATHHMTSDEFFRQNTEKFDIIFIDGLHYSEQVLRDIVNSLDVLNDNGYIVCHDMNPEKEEYQLIPPAFNQPWTGDCWKAFVTLRQISENLEMFVVNTDYGCGVIRKGIQKRVKITESLTYQNLDKNRKEWLNLIEVEDFVRM